jgi:fructose-1,6-bisphosphatase/inositol monophosphatase family enzyme
MIDINRIRNNVEQIACSTGEFLKEQQAQLHQSDIELKGTRNFVTHIDTEAEKMLVKKLGELIPGATFLTEEGTVTYVDGQYTWIIDPLDGTTNYVHGDTPFSVSVALMKDREIILGVVYDPVADELFSASAKGKVTLNGNSFKTSLHQTLTNGYIGWDNSENAVFGSKARQPLKSVMLPAEEAMPISIQASHLGMWRPEPLSWNVPEAHAPIFREAAIIFSTKNWWPATERSTRR